jgi:hypothetical protein
MAQAWTDDLKAEVISMYKDADPTGESSTEIIKGIAEKIEASPNGVRMVLVQAGVYVKKDAASKPSTDKKIATGDAPKRVSKESAIADLRAAIEARGVEVDNDVLDKLTGKAAVYLTKVLTQ